MLVSAGIKQVNNTCMVCQVLLQLLLCHLEDLCKVDVTVTAPVAALAPLSGRVCCAGDAVHYPGDCLSAHLMAARQVSIGCRAEGAAQQPCDLDSMAELYSVWSPSV